MHQIPIMWYMQKEIRGAVGAANFCPFYIPLENSASQFRWGLSNSASQIGL